MPEKLERCVSAVMAKGKSESDAYGICSESTGWKKAKGGGWTHKETKKKARQ